MSMKIENEKLILASQSPRRKQLLEQIGINIEVFPSDIDESTVSTQIPGPHVEELATLKAMDIAKQHPNSWTIGADTIVVIKDRILGKPGSKEDAIGMLKLLSSNEHYVYTAFCICHKTMGVCITKSVKTAVTFKTLSESEISWYVDTQEPFDKAGAYGIQGIGAFLVRKINGSYSNVVGLPVCEVFETLIELNAFQLRT